MKKKNPNNSSISLSNNSQIKPMLIPTLVIACLMLSMLGTSFASNIEEDVGYTIKLEIINGKQDAYIKKVKPGRFSDKIDTDASFSNLTCNTGELEYNEDNNTIYNDNVNSDINCILAFKDDGSKDILKSDLKSINDNTGTSYVYIDNSNDNYIKINDEMFRIIRINGDSTYRVILDKSIASTTYDNINDTLNNWLEEFNYNNIVIEDFDTNSYNELQSNLINFSGFDMKSVGLLSVNEANIILKNNSKSYLDNNMYLANKTLDDNAYAIVNGKITTISPSEELNIKPVINVKVNSLKGNGTINNPYEIK